MSGYAALVRMLAVRFMVLVAVLLMPLGMTPAAAGPHEPMAIDMTKGHCPGQSSHHEMKGGIAECTMACAGALPAADLANHEPLLMASEPIRPAAMHRLDGLHPDTATPPPKRS